MVALDIGPEVPLPSVKSLLAAGESDGRWYYEEGCIKGRVATVDIAAETPAPPQRTQRPSAVAASAPIS
jgi:hypothetical protein